VGRHFYEKILHQRTANGKIWYGVNGLIAILTEDWWGLVGADDSDIPEEVNY
jgi:hypothetical protein